MEQLRELFDGISVRCGPDDTDVAKHRSRLRHLTIIDARVMAGDLLCHTIRQALPDVDVDVVAGLNQVGQPSSGAFLYSFADRGCDRPTLARALAQLRSALGDAPLVVITDDLDGDQASLMRQFAVDHWISAASGFNALVATILKAVDGATTGRPTIAMPVEVSCPQRPSAMGLTTKERRILGLIHEGKPNKIIAFELACSESTVKVHVANMMRKLRLHNRTQLALFYQASSSESDVQAQLAPLPRLMVQPDRIREAAPLSGPRV